MPRLQTAVLALSILSYLASAKPITNGHNQDKNIDPESYNSFKLAFDENQFQLAASLEPSTTDHRSSTSTECDPKYRKCHKKLKPTSTSESLYPTKSASPDQTTSIGTLVDTSTHGAATRSTQKTTDTAQPRMTTSATTNTYTTTTRAPAGITTTGTATTATATGTTTTSSTAAGADTTADMYNTIATTTGTASASASAFTTTTNSNTAAVTSTASVPTFTTMANSSTTTTITGTGTTPTV